MVDSKSSKRTKIELIDVFDDESAESKPKSSKRIYFFKKIISEFVNFNADNVNYGFREQQVNI